MEKRPERRNSVMPGQDTTKSTLGCEEGDRQEKNEDRPPPHSYLSTLIFGALPVLSNHAPPGSKWSIQAKRLPERIFPAHPWLGSHWWCRCLSTLFPVPARPCQPGVSALGQALRTLCCGWGPPGLQWKRVPGTSFSWLCVEESRWLWMSENRHAAKHKAKGRPTGANPIQRTADERRRVYMTHCASGEEKQLGKKWTDSVIPETGQGYLHKPTLYNHDKQQQQKNTFTQKYKFEIINSTSVSDNSFLSPRYAKYKVTSVKGYIWILKAWLAGGGRGLWQRIITRILEENHRAGGSEVEKPTRNSTQGPSVYTWREGLEVVLDHKVQELDGAGSCAEILSASICHQDLANNVFWGFLMDGNIRRKWKLKKV